MNQENNHIAPPRWSQRLLKVFLKGQYLEEIEGDLEEVYDDFLEKYSVKKSRRLYNLEVLKVLRPTLVKPLSGSQKLNYYGMLKHNFILTFRNYMRYKSTFLINLIGLSTGLACTLLIYLWIHSEFQINRFHEKSDRLYQVLINMETSNGLSTTLGTPALMPQKLAETMPEVEYATMQSWLGVYTLSHDETNIKAVGQYGGKDYFNVFSYDLVQGDKNSVLEDKSSMVISEKLANQLFGSTVDVVGQTIKYMHLKDFRVSGIFKNPPASSTHRFDFVMPIEEFKEAHSWALDWRNVAPSSFVVLREGTDVDAFNTKIANVVKDNNGEQNMTPFAALYADLYLNGKFENGQPTNSKLSSLRLVALIAFFILVIACINFMNLSTARVSRRLKEIGIKKAVGANRWTLIAQFLSESLITVFIAMVMAILLVSLLLPQFNEITGKTVSLVFTRELVLMMVLILATTGILSGSYPAFFLSGFAPVKTLKGQVPSSLREIFIRKGLVIFQFSLSIILIIVVLVVQQQIDFIQTTDPGFNKDNIVTIDAEGETELKMEAFIDELKKIPGVLGASSTAHSITGPYAGTTFDVKWEGKAPEDPVEMEYMRVDYDFIELLEFDILEGRSFSRELKSDIGKVIFNETSIEIMGLKDPVGSIVNVFGKDQQIIGVVKDFHFRSLHQKIGPAFFVLKPSDTWVFMARLAEENQQQTLSAIKNLHDDFNPGFEFTYQFMDNFLDSQYSSEEQTSALSGYFAGLAIIISCLGLFGLAAFTAERRIKEIGIRKILGSSTINIVRLLSADFTKTVLISMFIALPVGYYVSRSWLNDFAYHTHLSWWFFAISGIAALSIAWLTVGIQTFKAASANPARCLRDE